MNNYKWVHFANIVRPFEAETRGPTRLCRPRTAQLCGIHVRPCWSPPTILGILAYLNSNRIVAWHLHCSIRVGSLLKKHFNLNFKH